MDNNINQTIIEKVAIKSVAIYKAIAMLPPPEIKDLWAENNYTKQTQNDLKLDAKDNCVTMKKTKTELTPVDWRDITDPEMRRKMRKKAYREANKDKIKERGKAYREANRDKLKLQRKDYYKVNKDKLNKQSKDYYESNKNKIKEQHKAYRGANRDKRKEYNREYCRNRKKTDIQFKLSNNLRGRLKRVIRGNYKSGSAVKDLGCTVDELKDYLESKFQPGMSWDNWSKDGWHIDHIKPLASFDLTDHKQLLEACHYTNLQPLWASDNLAKGNKINQ